MNVILPRKVTKAEFYAFVLKHEEGRFEYERGRIVQQMTGGTFRHSMVSQRFLTAFVQRLDPAVWAVTGHSRAIEMDETIRYPDVLVERIPDDMASLATLAPVVAVEVLSPDSKSRDLKTKPAEYLEIPTLSAYIVARQDAAECRLWMRQSDGSFPGTADTVKGLDTTIELQPLGIAIPLSEIYRGLGVT